MSHQLQRHVGFQTICGTEVFAVIAYGNCNALRHDLQFQLDTLCPAMPHRVSHRFLGNPVELSGSVYAQDDALLIPLESTGDACRFPGCGGQLLKRHAQALRS
jgi:hypothetical protein